MDPKKLKEYVCTQYYHYLISFCRQFVCSKMDAEDVLHDSFVVIFDKIDQGFLWQGELAFKGWLKKIVYTRTLNYLRNKSRCTATEDHLLPDLGVYSLAAGMSIPQQLLNLSKKLPDRQRAVFLLFHYHGLSMQDIARLLGVSLSTVKTHRRLAECKMRSAIQCDL